MLGEQVQSYLLTLQVRNAPDLVAEAQLNIKVKDENNKSPVFTNIDSGQDTDREKEGFSVIDPECLFIPNPNVFHLGSRFRILPIPDPGFALKKNNFSILT